MATIENVISATQQATAETTKQYCTDILFITLQRYGFGEKRIRRFVEDWNTTFDKFYEALRGDPERQEALDINLCCICKSEPIASFNARYPHLASTEPNETPA